MSRNEKLVASSGLCLRQHELGSPNIGSCDIALSFRSIHRSSTWLVELLMDCGRCDAVIALSTRRESLARGHGELRKPRRLCAEKSAVQLAVQLKVDGGVKNEIARCDQFASISSNASSTD